MAELITTNFRTCDTSVEVNTIDNRERTNGRNNYVEWGTDNIYPQYIHDLRKSVPTLGSIITGCTDYIAGDDVICTSPSLYHGRFVNRSRQTPQQLLREIADSIAEIGGAALHVISTADHTGIAEVYCLPLRYLRCDEDCERFNYSEKWEEKFARKANNIIYPKWIRGIDEGIVLLKYNGMHQTYPAPVYEAAVVDAETERRVADYHLNAIANGFAGSYMINFNNGNTLSETQKDEIERGVREKFAGNANAGRIGISFNQDVRNQTTFTKMDIDDWGTRYESLEKHARQQIYAAFRANPVLFGLPSENMGFNNSADEYEQSFRLFNRTFIRPIQNAIIDTLNDLYGGAYWTINPFTI